MSAPRRGPPEAPAPAAPCRPAAPAPPLCRHPGPRRRYPTPTGRPSPSRSGTLADRNRVLSRRRKPNDS
ncbi:hypothetical protein GCM10010515_28300 [Streptomyces fructofermentans]|uniref:Uncharacterized protein n=1 Tax=Streptomyces fructofermentans TaxID=152141 RepID=A0A918KCP1_9ACTN|nr:hypothetical protein GCM10010515_28300 [Streptomyces fructofermentans]